MATAPLRHVARRVTTTAARTPRCLTHTRTVTKVRPNHSLLSSFVVSSRRSSTLSSLPSLTQRLASRRWPAQSGLCLSSHLPGDSLTGHRLARTYATAANGANDPRFSWVTRALSDDMLDDTARERLYALTILQEPAEFSAVAAVWGLLQMPEDGMKSVEETGESGVAWTTAQSAVVEKEVMEHLKVYAKLKLVEWTDVEGVHETRRRCIRMPNVVRELLTAHLNHPQSSNMPDSAKVDVWRVHAAQYFVQVLFEISQHLRLFRPVRRDVEWAVEFLGDRIGGGSNAFGVNVFGACLTDLGNAYLNVGELDLATETHRRRLVLAEKHGDVVGQAAAYNGLGNVAQFRGEYDEALSHHRKVLDLEIELGNRRGEGSSYANIGIILASQGKASEALAYHNKHLAIAKELNLDEELASAYGNLGICHQLLGNFDRALELHSKHLELAVELGDEAAESRSYGNIGLVYHQEGLYEKAVECYHKQIRLAARLGDVLGLGRAYGCLGQTLQAQGNTQAAIDVFRQSLDVWRRLRFTASHQFVTTTLDALKQLGDTETKF